MGLVLVEGVVESQADHAHQVHEDRHRGEGGRVGLSGKGEERYLTVEESEGPEETLEELGHEDCGSEVDARVLG